ncbi:hypothetical protein WUBG_07231 [Wuchereria bancrofti]|uniref:Uncharacterized protein n=1 Tax=Wuchereria bancrofti TaxID=6293 RepID=J9B4D1_WUCBA|nr:hypothetical protein WUBG_07231 [Wuchereria bancrofti]
MSHPTVLRINNEVNVFIYIAGGLVVFTLNIFYFAAIVRTKINRERYGLTGMEFFADGLMGFAITLAGATRNAQIFLGNQNDTVSRIICVIMPHNVILAWLVYLS